MTLTIVLAFGLWLTVAGFLLFLNSIGDGMGRAFGYPTSGWVDRILCFLWPLVLPFVLLYIVVELINEYRKGVR